MPLAVHCVFRGAWYAMCGTSGPIFRDGCWEFVAPCPRFSTGICCILGRHTSLRALPAPGVHTAEVKESHGDSSLASAVKTHCDNDIVAFFDVAGKFHSCPPPKSETVRRWLEQCVPSCMLNANMRQSWYGCCFALGVVPNPNLLQMISKNFGSI